EGSRLPSNSGVGVHYLNQSYLDGTAVNAKLLWKRYRIRYKNGSFILRDRCGRRDLTTGLQVSHRQAVDTIRKTGNVIIVIIRAAAITIVHIRERHRDVSGCPVIRVCKRPGYRDSIGSDLHDDTSLCVGGVRIAGRIGECGECNG